MQAYTDSHFRPELSMFLFVHLRQDIIPGWVESQANVPVGAAVERSNSVHPPHERRVVCYQHVRPNASKGSCAITITRELQVPQQNVPYFLLASKMSKCILPFVTARNSHMFENVAGNGPLKCRRRYHAPIVCATKITAHSKLRKVNIKLQSPQMLKTERRVMVFIGRPRPNSATVEKATK
jgi:hypothetical protein